MVIYCYEQTREEAEYDLKLNGKQESSQFSAEMRDVAPWEGERKFWN